MIGYTFLSEPSIPSGKRHLMIIVAEKDSECLFVPVTTWYEEMCRQDDSCILNVGDYKFIKHKSWVDFSRADTMSFVDIANGLFKRRLVPEGIMDPKILAYVQAKTEVSDNLPEKYRVFFQVLDKLHINIRKINKDSFQEGNGHLHCNLKRAIVKAVIKRPALATTFFCFSKLTRDNES